MFSYDNENEQISIQMLTPNDIISVFCTLLMQHLESYTVSRSFSKFCTVLKCLETKGLLQGEQENKEADQFLVYGYNRD